MAEKKRGTLVVFEGLDRSGKSTQVGYLAQEFELNHIRYEYIKFPGVYVVFSFMKERAYCILFCFRPEHRLGVDYR